MVNGLGVLGWGVGGIEAEAAMLGESDLDASFRTSSASALHGALPEGSDRHRPRAHRDADPAPDRCRREVRRVRGARGRGAIACRPRDTREHVSRVRGHPAASSPWTTRRSATCDSQGGTTNTWRSSRPIARRTGSGTTPTSSRPIHRSSSSISRPSSRRSQDHGAPGPRPARRSEALLPGGAFFLRRRLRHDPSTRRLAESFPASDPPLDGRAGRGGTDGHAGGARRRRRRRSRERVLRDRRRDDRAPGTARW